MMDENYEDEEDQQPIEEPLPTFEYESKDEVELNKLIHSILIESSKTKGLIPNCLTKRIGETVGLESNDDTFYNLMGMLAQLSLSNLATEIKNMAKVDKNKKERVLSTADVREILEEKGIYLSASKVIPELGISEAKHSSYDMAE